MPVAQKLPSCLETCILLLYENSHWPHIVHSFFKPEAIYQPYSSIRWRAVFIVPESSCSRDCSISITIPLELLLTLGFCLDGMAASRRPTFVSSMSKLLVPCYGYTNSRTVTQVKLSSRDRRSSPCLHFALNITTSSGIFSSSEDVVHLLAHGEREDLHSRAFEINGQRSVVLACNGHLSEKGI